MELLWALAADAPSVVVEANFRPYDPYQRGKLSVLAEIPVEVHCRCDPRLAARRYNERARTCHPVHVQASLPAGVRAEYDQPVGIGKLVTGRHGGPGGRRGRRCCYPCVLAGTSGSLAERRALRPDVATSRPAGYPFG